MKAMPTKIDPGEVDAGDRPSSISTERAKVWALKAQVRQLEEDNAIVMDAAVLSAGELDPRKR
jgi:hypothetical protein